MFYHKIILDLRVVPRETQIDKIISILWKNHLQDKEYERAQWRWKETRR